ncbi:Ncb2p [Saccharomyces cerevisiae AWRI796]|uniref:Putative uncharacterized protein YDR396W n=3 Tax=Saccharomyces cerevisiae TaxID=4932 RepID=YD396_YEAST|nr:RecName: Full=Putative uncharacterized protein YDR396W [Saccharomyces cerevisiae S288C]AAB64850.1 Ydr396wp [Saccharomyces cerevisiae]EDZ72864.1 hypothetical protein AWRI1631_46160 [Saccharomyces cerevisiae AWRI1631]EGA62902.1 Ncb2p [Saccharomyces cerevisiae FostersO]EGA75426.1 Ncb2p [Saccharomyces cerevisiae AWRI796]CAY78899.1 EC1118_1D0_6986p [Saccharomyces cerevisiae EC1118]
MHALNIFPCGLFSYIALLCLEASIQEESSDLTGSDTLLWCNLDLDCLNNSSCCRSSSSSERPDFLNLESLVSFTFWEPLKFNNISSKNGINSLYSNSSSALITCSGAMVFLASLSAISEAIEDRIIMNSMPELMMISLASLVNIKSWSSISDIIFCTVAKIIQCFL